MIEGKIVTPGEGAMLLFSRAFYYPQLTEESIIASKILYGDNWYKVWWQQVKPFHAPRRENSGRWSDILSPALVKALNSTDPSLLRDPQRSEMLQEATMSVLRELPNPIYTQALAVRFALAGGAIKNWTDTGRELNPALSREDVQRIEARALRDLKRPHLKEGYIAQIAVIVTAGTGIDTLYR